MTIDAFQIEGQIAQWVEGKFSRLLGGTIQPREIALHLIRKLEEHASPMHEDGRSAPSRYAVALHTDDHAALAQSQPNLRDSLISALYDWAMRAEIIFSEALSLRIVGDPALARGTIVVQPLSEDTLDTTKPFMPISMPDPIIEEESPLTRIGHPRLILQDMNRRGIQDIPLTSTVTNIGRRRDNHIVIDDPDVSRLHAQLRIRHGEIVIYDLGSQVGTFVNDQRITESILRSGDVISLSGVILIYLDDSAGQQPADIVQEGQNYTSEALNTTAMYSVPAEWSTPDDLPD